MSKLLKMSDLHFVSVSAAEPGGKPLTAKPEKYLPQKPSKLKILHRFDRNVWPRQGLVKLLLPAVSANTSWCLDSDLAKPTSELKILMFLSVFYVFMFMFSPLQMVSFQCWLKIQSVHKNKWL